MMKMYITRHIFRKITGIFALPLLLLCSFIISCDEVGEDERLVLAEEYVLKAPVLVEDFTGQRCVNCPTAHEEIERLQKIFGEENIITVAIHGGPLASFPTSKLNGLRTAMGDEYYNAWNIEALPAAYVNRTGQILYNSSELMGTIRQNVSRGEKNDVVADCTYDAETNMLRIGVKAKKPDLQGESRLQVWVVEDSIVAPQLKYNDPMDKSLGETIDAEYLHRNVLRAAANDTWGTMINVAEGEYFNGNFEIEANPAWNIRHLSIVAFTYSDGQVWCVTKTKVKQ